MTVSKKKTKQKVKQVRKGLTPTERRKIERQESERREEPLDVVSAAKDRLGLARDIIRIADRVAENDIAFDDRSTRRHQRVYQAAAVKFASSLIDEVNAALYDNDDGTAPMYDYLP